MLLSSSWILVVGLVVVVVVVVVLGHGLGNVFVFGPALVEHVVGQCPHRAGLLGFDAMRIVFVSVLGELSPNRSTECHGFGRIPRCNMTDQPQTIPIQLCIGFCFVCLLQAERDKKNRPETATETM